MDATSASQRGGWVAVGIFCAAVGLIAIVLRDYYSPSLQAALDGRFVLSDFGRLLLMLLGISSLVVGVGTCVLAAFPAADDRAVHNGGFASGLLGGLATALVVLVLISAASHSDSSTASATPRTSAETETTDPSTTVPGRVDTDESLPEADDQGSEVVCFPDGCTQGGAAVRPPESHAPCQNRAGWTWERSGINKDGSDRWRCTYSGLVEGGE